MWYHIRGSCWYSKYKNVKSIQRTGRNAVLFGTHVGFRIAFDSLTKPVFNNICQHEFKEYNGFMESYHYCIKCDKKRV